MLVDSTFQDLPTGPTFNVWRIENFKAVPWTDFGSFYTGDSYLVLSATEVGDPPEIQRHVYYWIGSESTADEYVTAAAKAIELDNRFGGEPIQHREVQYHESSDFVKLFDSYGGLTYLAGGVASGFKAVDRTKGVRLYQVKGRRDPVLLQVPPSGASLNQGDAFILTTDGAIYLWVGTSANIREKQKAALIAENLRVKFKGVPVTRLENGATTPAFWALLGGEVPIAESSVADEVAEAANVRKIYKVDGDKYALIAEGPAAARRLLSGGVFVVSRGEDVVVFLGKGTPPEVKKNAIDIGVKFLAEQGAPSYYPITVVREGVESDILPVIFA
jgi:hypothetical protein